MKCLVIKLVAHEKSLVVREKVVHEKSVALSATLNKLLFNCSSMDVAK